MKQFLLLCIYSGVFYAVSFAQPGTLDETFGENGKVLTGLTNGYPECFAAAIQKDQKILAAGSSDNFLIFRYLPNGSIDSSFGEKGKVTTDFLEFSTVETSYSTIYSLALQPDEKIVAAGSGFVDFFYDENGFKLANYNITLTRYMPDGRLDSAFGRNGKVVTDFIQYDYAYSMQLQSDGKIVTGGYISSGAGGYYDFLVVRYCQMEH